MENVRIYEIPACKMVSSQCGMFGDGALELFDEWFSLLPRTMFPKDFLWFDKARNGFVWYYIYDEAMSIPDGFDIVDFPGGLYAVATDIDGQDNKDPLNAIADFIHKKACFEVDPSRQSLGNIITPPAAADAMGYNQMDYYTPIRIVK